MERDRLGATGHLGAPSIKTQSSSYSGELSSLDLLGGFAAAMS